MSEPWPVGLDYDPEAHAAALGLTIVQGGTTRGNRGEYWHRQRVIRLAPGVTGRERRTVIAHEIQHHLAGHERAQPPEVEHYIRARTARQLITPGQWAAAWTHHGEEVGYNRHGWSIRERHVSITLNVALYVLDDWRMSQA